MSKPLPRLLVSGWVTPVLGAAFLAALGWLGTAVFQELRHSGWKHAAKDPHVLIPLTAVLVFGIIYLFVRRSQEGPRLVLSDRTASSIRVESVIDIKRSASILNEELLRRTLGKITTLYKRPEAGHKNTDIFDSIRHLRILKDVKIEPVSGKAPKALPAPPAPEKKTPPVVDADQQTPGDRFPAAAFFMLSRASAIELPQTQPLSPAGPGASLEFRFWIDVKKRGIRSQSEQPAISPPVAFPLTLAVKVWSDDFRFKDYAQELTLRAEGVTKHARFRVESLPVRYTRGELFVFVQHEGNLVMALRVEALVSDQPDQRPAQVLDYLYLATDWFRFAQPRGADSRTIFITKKQSNLQLFTLKPDALPWSALGPAETGLYEHNKDMYRALHSLALAAAEAANAGKTLRFSKEFGHLAELGYKLFTDVFFQGDETSAAAFYEKFLKALPEGACVTVVIGKEAQNLCIPWGLLYDRRPPYGFSESPDRTGFWGYKYNLVVRPWITPIGGDGAERLPVRMGAAWLDHAETEALRKTLAAYGNSLAVRDVRVADYTIPAMATEEFDLVEFFCHGHTRLTDVFSPQEAEQILDTYRQSSLEAKEKQTLLMAIGSSSDSLVELNGGFATLATLSETLQKGMRGAPLILLSMCESAQVSCSGSAFVTLFLKRGARAVIGTEGPTLWSLSRAMDTLIIRYLMFGNGIGEAFFIARRELAQSNMLALIYTLYGDRDARLVNVVVPPPIP
jgi:hypothetical protein